VIDKAGEADAASVAMARKLLALNSMGTPRPLGQIA
jgi:hypothetical protein